MKIALIADLHGNMTATLALEKDLAYRKVDQIICLGDLVGKGPRSDLTFDWAMAHCDLILRGNWDEGIGKEAFPHDSFYHRQLGKARLNALCALPLEHTLHLARQSIRLIHGRPVMPTLLSLNDSEETWKPYLERHDMLIYADSHRQGMRTLNCGILCNTGSVGNSTGINRVQYMILEVGPHTPGIDCTMLALPYDVQAAAKEAMATENMPFRDAYIHEITTGEYVSRFGLTKVP